MKPWPQPKVCSYCRVGESFFTHSEEVGEPARCTEFVGERVIHGVRVMAMCACDQSTPDTGEHECRTRTR